MMDEARNAGVRRLPRLADFPTHLSTSRLRTVPGKPAIESALESANSTQDRAHRLLRLLWETYGGRVGHL